MKFRLSMTYSEIRHIPNRTLRNPGIFRILAFSEQEAYSEPWYIKKPRNIQNPVKHLRWSVLQI